MMDKIKSITRGQVILACLVLVIIFSIFMTIEGKKKSNIKKYHEFEKNLITDAKHYYKRFNPTIRRDELKKVTISTLKKKNLISNFDLLDSGCQGYVIIENSQDVDDGKYKIMYSSYLKCKNYKTANYDNYYDY